MNGILLVNKPSGPTSFNVIRKIKMATNLKEKIGHTGTLDPMASGLLVICIGQATRIAQFVIGLDKEYIGEITFGIRTDTYDATGETIETISEIQPTLEDILDIIPKISGELQQSPPLFSAVKQEGVRLYKLAYKGEAPKSIKPRKVTVYSFEILEYNYPFLRFKTIVSSGTYIRSIANDLGEKLRCGAHLSELRRTKISYLSIEDAFHLDELMNANNSMAFLTENIFSVQYALRHLPKIFINKDDKVIMQKISHGENFIIDAKLLYKEMQFSLLRQEEISYVLAMEKQSNCELAVCKIISKNETSCDLRPKVVFNQ